MAAIVAITAGLFGLNRWAGQKNAARDAGITWVDVTSPRTLQTYVVRAQVDRGELQRFTLEAGDRYDFRGCKLPSRGAGACTDLAGLAWTIDP